MKGSFQLVGRCEVVDETAATNLALLPPPPPSFSDASAGQIRGRGKGACRQHLSAPVPAAVSAEKVEGDAGEA